MSQSRYVVYQDNEDEWRWCFVSSNGRILADSSDAYSSKTACRIVLTHYRENAAAANITDRGRRGKPRERSRKSRRK